MLETLRPNVAGDENALLHKDGSAGDANNYQEVDEAGADDDTTYVYKEGANYLRDLYNIGNHSGSGIIGSITVNARCKFSSVIGVGQVKLVIKSGTGAGAPDTVDEANGQTIFNSWGDFTDEWATNPATGSAWTWDEIDNLQIGVSLEAALTKSTLCTQVYVEVDYTPAAVVGKTLANNEQPLASDINTIFQWGTIGARPATDDVTAGSFYYTTDTNILYQEQNGTWVGLPFE